MGVDFRSGRRGIDIDDAGVLDDAFDAGSFALVLNRSLGVDIDSDGLGIGETISELDLRRSLDIDVTEVMDIEDEVADPLAMRVDDRQVTRRIGVGKASPSATATASDLDRTAIEVVEDGLRHLVFAELLNDTSRLGKGVGVVIPPWHRLSA